jgi:hypothetical protein
MNHLEAEGKEGGEPGADTVIIEGLSDARKMKCNN